MGSLAKSAAPLIERSSLGTAHASQRCHYFFRGLSMPRGTRPVLALSQPAGDSMDLDLQGRTYGSRVHARHPQCSAQKVGKTPGERCRSVDPARPSAVANHLRAPAHSPAARRA